MAVYVEPGCCGGGVATTFPDAEYQNLDAFNQKLVRNAEQGDPESCYQLGKDLIEGQNGFPIMLNLGEHFLLQSTKENHVESLLYYGQVLNQGDKIPKNEKKAQKCFKKAASKGSSEAHVRIGQIYVEENNIKKAIKEFKTGIKNNNSQAMMEMAKLYREGNGIKQNDVEATNLIKRASDNGYHVAINEYAECLRTGLGCKADLGAAAAMYKKLADQGNTKSMHQYAHMLENGEGVEADVAQAAEYYKTAADKGNPDSMFAYFEHLEDGKGVESNHELAIEYLKKSAEAGHTKGMYFYSVQLYYGNWYPKDEGLAEEYAKKAALQGYADSEYFYGEILTNKEEYQQAATYYLSAANKGHVDAQLTLASMRMYGRGCKIDFTSAKQLFDKNADHPESQLGLGIMYENGYGVKRDYETALGYYRSLENTPLCKEGLAHEGYMLLHGYGFKKADSKKAIDMLKKSAETEGPHNRSTYGAAQYAECLFEKNAKDAIPILEELAYTQKDMWGREKLAYCYANGIGVAKNVDKCLQLYKLSAAQGSCNALYAMGTILLEGRCGLPSSPSESISYFKQSAKLGNLDAEVTYSRCQLNGTGLPVKNEKKAFKHAKIAADGENINGKALLGTMLYYGKGCDSNPEAARPYIIDASNAKIPEAMDVYGQMLADGESVTQDEAQAVQLFKEAHELGFVESTYHYAQSLEAGKGCDQNFAQAAQLYKIAADQNHHDSEFKYAWFSEEGQYIPKNEKEAVTYYEKAANGGHADAMANYAVMLLNGIGIKKNAKEAFKWNKQAAELNNTKAMNNVATQLLTGNGCSKKPKEAIKYLETSVQRGNVHAIYLLGTVYEAGQGVDQNMNTAANKYREAAQKGDEEAMLRTADLLLEGVYLDRDTVLAYNYYKFLADKGNVECCIKTAQHFEEITEIEQAAHYWGIAAEKENPFSMYTYGKMCLEGKGLAKNETLGVEYMKKAADAKIPLAITRYATIINTGAFGVKKDQKAALKMFKQSSDMGNANAFHHLGTLYYYGQGTKKDLKKSIAMFEKSVQGNSRYADDDKNRIPQIQQEIEDSKKK